MLKYLSYSSFKEYEECNEKFRLKRIEGHWPKREPILAADVGIIFDAYVKCALDRSLKLEKLLQNINQNVHELHAKAQQIAHILYLAYRDSGALQNLIDEGVAVVELNKEILFHINDQHVVFRGKPDCILSNGTIADWKVNGVGSTRGASPKYGYCRRINYEISTGTIDVKKPHERQTWNLEDINIEWAKQTVLYSFLCGKKPGSDIYAGIEQLAIRGGKLAIVSFRNEIGKRFQYECWNNLGLAWKNIIENKWPLPIFEERKCHKYGKVCEVAEYCEAYNAETTEETM